MKQTRRIVLLLVLLIINCIGLMYIFKSSYPTYAIWIFIIEALLCVSFANKLYYFFFPNEKQSNNK